MRKRLVAGMVGLVVVASACGGPAATPRTATTPPAVATAPPPPNNPLADCVLSITPWLQTYLDGGTGLGDYQEMVVPPGNSIASLSCRFA